MSKDRPTTLLTGATGFLGQYILGQLLARGRRVVAVLRPPLTASRTRLIGLMQPLSVDLTAALETGQLHLVAGTLPDDLPPATWGRTDEIVACAASLQLYCKGNGEPFSTNVAGTQAMLDWADRHEVRRAYVVSTAYVCGSYTDCVGEVFHHPQPVFHTDYEMSKWQAEQLWQRWAGQSGRILTVFRPSFLVGDSVSGYTSQYGGFISWPGWWVYSKGNTLPTATASEFTCRCASPAGPAIRRTSCRWILRPGSSAK